MRCLRVLTAALMVLTLSAVLGPVPTQANAKKTSLHQRCAALFTPSKRQFDLRAFMHDFNHRQFKDRDGRAFRFRGITIAPDADEGLFNLSVRHDQLGFIPSDSDSGFYGLRLTPTGDLDGVNWSIDYHGGKNNGFLGALFSYLKTRLPEGSRFSLIDASATADIHPVLYAVTDAQLEDYVSTDAAGAALYALYLQVISLPSFRSERRLLSLAGEGLSIPDGFRAYLSDLYSIWGRVARKGNYRKDYLNAQAPRTPVTEWIKRGIPDEIIAAEDAILSSPEGRELSLLK